MLHINDADQSAMPADENKKQEQEGLEPLPWDVGKGFLWGLPKTAWLVLKNPFIAFRAPQAAGILRVWLFAIFFDLILYILQYTINWLLYPLTNQEYEAYGVVSMILDNIHTFSSLIFFKGIMRIILMVIISNFFSIICWSVCIWVILLIFRISRDKPDKCFRIICYATVSDIFAVMPWNLMYISYLSKCFIIFAAIKKIYSTGTKTALLIAALGSFLSRFLTQHFIDLYVTPIIRMPF